MTRQIAQSTAVIEPEVVLQLDDEALMMQLGHYFQVSRTGLTVVSQPPLSAFHDLERMLNIGEKGIHFAVGDMMNAAEGLYGEEASQLLDATDWTEKTIKNYMYVCAKVPQQIRRHELDFSHHILVAPLTSIEVQKKWLDLAVIGTDGTRWTVAQLKKAIATDGVLAAPKPPKWEVIVPCESKVDLDACCRQLENLGRAFKTREPK